MSVLQAIGVTAAVVVVIAVASLGVALIIGRGIRVADQAAAPTVAELLDVDLDMAAVAADDAYIDDLAASRAPDNADDPTLTRMFAAHRDEARKGT